MKYLSVIGTRPQTVKLAPIYQAFEDAGVEHDYIDTGQHYDPALSNEIQNDLGIPDPVKNLKVGSHSHAIQTAIIMEKLDEELNRLKPETVLVYGDTNSTIASALVAVKKGIRTAHVESGLRSFNRAMPEEINRVATDHLADVLFCPTKTAISNLRNEGLGERAINVGDVMCDLLIRDFDKFKIVDSEAEGFKDGFLVATLHRAENTDSSERLSSIVHAFNNLPFRIVLFAHPRLRIKLSEFNLAFGQNVQLREPVNHTKLLSWAISSLGVLTDSGGFQKEAFILGVPCTTIRGETEWLETLENGWNVLVSDVAELGSKINIQRDRPKSSPFGDGKSAQKIVEYLTIN